MRNAVQMSTCRRCGKGENGGSKLKDRQCEQRIDGSRHGNGLQQASAHTKKTRTLRIMRRAKLRISCTAPDDDDRLFDNNFKFEIFHAESGTDLVP